MKKLLGATALATALFSAPTHAADISTHVLDITRGEGGAGIPVTLSRQGPDGSWMEIAATETGANGRASEFGEHDKLIAGTYLLQFNMAAYEDSQTASFFPTITVAFVVSDSEGKYHVPVLVSPYGYSTYRGN